MNEKENNLYESLNNSVLELEGQYKKLKEIFIKYDGYESIDERLSFANLLEQAQNYCNFYKSQLIEQDNDKLNKLYKSNKDDEEPYLMGECKLINYHHFRKDLLNLIFSWLKVNHEISRTFGDTDIIKIIMSLIRIYGYSHNISLGEEEAFDMAIGGNTPEKLYNFYNKRFDPFVSLDMHDSDDKLLLSEEWLQKIESVLNEDLKYYK